MMKLSTFLKCSKYSPSLTTVRSFYLNPEQIILQKMSRDFAEKELMPVAAHLDQNSIFPEKQIEKLGQLGVMGLTADEKYNGIKTDILSLSLIVEELARACASTASIVFIHNCLYVNLLQRMGTEQQKEEFLKPYTRGKLGAFALSESGAGSDVSSMETTARLEGDFWILNGTKSWVTSGIEADVCCLFATIDKSLGHKGITGFLVPLNTNGLTRGKKENKMGIKASSTCSLYLDNVKIPKSNLIGEVGKGFKIAMEQLDLARIGIASQAIGISQGALDTAINYSQQRIAFGKPLIKLSAIQTRLAEMSLKIESARLLTWKAAVLKDSGLKSTKNSSMAKWAASECSQFVTHNCIQILGGMGYVNDMPAERFYRDSRITEIYGGVTDIQKLIIAEQLIKEYGFDP